MASDIVGAWERKSLYYHPQAAWGTHAKDEVSINFHRLKEISRSFPYIPPPVVVPADGLGRGSPWNDEADFHLAQGGGTFQTTHPMTDTSLRDLLWLFFNGLHYDVAETERVLSPTDAADAVVWVPEMTEWASLTVCMDSGTAPLSVIHVTSAVVSQLDINIPQATPGETGGMCEITPTWLFEESARATADGLGTETDDEGVPLYTRDWTFKIVTDTRNFINANISLTNGCQLIREGGSALSSGALMGKLGLTGSVTVYFDQIAGAHAGATTDDFCTLLEGTSGKPDEKVIHLVYHDLHTDDDDVDIELPIIISGPPVPGDLGGVATMTFNFQMAGDADTPPRVTFHSVTEFDAGLFH